RKLARLVKPSLYYNTKAKKLKSFVNFLYEKYNGNLDLMLKQPKEKLREQLLEVWGVGPETADSILLYAGNKKSFVVDAYTKRIFHRLGLIGKNSSYDEVKDFFEENLPGDVRVYNEYHALIVELGKNYCRKKPLCKECCIKKYCFKRI
ncbi:MAG: endonuclease III domain-containing protein, partial [Candidatus Altiarchaeota archaeon]